MTAIGEPASGLRLFCVVANCAHGRPEDVRDERAHQPPIAQELLSRAGVGGRGATLVREQRSALAVRHHAEAGGDLAPSGLRERGEVLRRDITPFDVRLPELADRTEDEFVAWPLSEDQPARQRIAL